MNKKEIAVLTEIVCDVARSFDEIRPGHIEDSLFQSKLDGAILMCNGQLFLLKVPCSELTFDLYRSELRNMIKNITGNLSEYQKAEDRACFEGKIEALRRILSCCNLVEEDMLKLKD